MLDVDWSVKVIRLFENENGVRCDLIMYVFSSSYVTGMRRPSHVVNDGDENIL